MAAPKQPAQPATRKRWPMLAALLAVIVVVAVWLSNCIPGFGIGGSGSAGDGKVEDGDGERADAAKREGEPEKKAEPPEPPKPEPPKPEPPQVGSAGTTLTVNIDVNGCTVAGSEAQPIDCAKMCEQTELFTGIDDAVLEVAGASHGSVVAMLDCLKAKGIDKVAVRRE